MEREETFSIKSTYTVWHWFFLLLLIAWTLALAVFILAAINADRYFDLDITSFICLLNGFFWTVWASQVYRQTKSVQLFDDSFIVKKIGRKPARYSYADIQAYNERLEINKVVRANELTIYLADNWFAVLSGHFAEYDYLKDRLTCYGQPVSYRDALTPTERNWLGWFIGGMALLIGMIIALSFVMHNPADPNPARLVSVTGTVGCVQENNRKGRLKGVTICLLAFPGFSFYVSHRQYDVRLETLASTLTPNRPVTLLIRASDLRKKLKKTEPLTFGDKYDDYGQIMVFGVNQGNSVDILTPGPVYEPTHTNPWLRTFLLSILLLCCWTGWVWVDEHKLR